jgi:hypothetical protein
VNLAAPGELQASEERKGYLDRQAEDLEEAVTTLEDAIRRIDRETRELLRETFDAVNRHFGTLFPVLFGGGDAQLLMTGEEILDAGVQVMAHPPGKRNTSIHLLSGGEKALTAIALVFAMFQLNPGALLPARRGGRAARRLEHAALLRAGAPHVGADAVPVHQPQQDHHGDGGAADRRHHARIRACPAWWRWTSRRRCASGRSSPPDRGGPAVAQAMSDLQIGLLAVGAVVVAGVVAYNLAQERRARRSAEKAFGSAHADVLLEERASAPRAELRAGAAPAGCRRARRCRIRAWTT